MKHLYLILLLPLFITLGACKKNRFNKFGNEVIVSNVPSFCNPCYLTISNTNTDDLYSELYHTYSEDGFTRFYMFDGSKDSTYNVFIDWQKLGLVYPEKGEIQLRLIQIVANDQMPWTENYDFSSHSQDVYFKPRRVYDWDVMNKTFTETGDKTDKIDRPKPTSSTSSSSGTDCTNLNYTGPTNDVQLESWCRMAQAYACEGNDAGLQIVCQNIEDFCTGCNCPYCP
jgi:hypothetical protein